MDTIKYDKLKTNLYTIKNKIDSLITYNDELYLLLKENLLINDSIIDNELLSSIKKDLLEIQTEIENNIIPLIDTKI